LDELDGLTLRRPGGENVKVFSDIKLIHWGEDMVTAGGLG